MNKDGSVIIETKIDESGIDKGTQSINSKLGSFASKGAGVLAQLGKAAVAGLAATGAAVTGFGAYAIKAGMDFDSGMSEVASISGATGKDLDSLRDKAKEMGATTNFSATEASEGLKYMALAGWNTEQMISGLPAVLHLAGAAGMELARASDIVTDTMSAFGLEAEEASRVSDVFATTQMKSNTNVEMLGEAMKYAAPAAQAWGMSLEQTNAVLGIWANAGIKGSMAGTTFTAMLSDLRKNTEDGAIAIGDMRVEVENADGSLRDIGSIMADVEKATSGMTDAQKNATLANTFGEQSLKGVNAMLAQGSDAYKQLEQDIYNSAGAAKEAYKIMNDNLKGDIEALKSGIEGIGISLFENIDTPFREVVQKLTGYTERINKAMTEDIASVPEVLGDIISDALGYIYSLLPRALEIGVQILTSIIDGLTSNMDKISSGMGELILKLAEVVATLIPKILELGVNIVTGIVKGIIDGLTSNVESLNSAGAAMLENILLGIVDTITNVAGTALDIITALVDGVSDGYPKFLETGAEIIKKLIDGIGSRLPDLLAKVGELIAKFSGLFMQNFPNMVKIGIEVLVHLIKGIASTIPQVLVTILKLLGSIMLEFAKFIFKMPGMGLDIILGLIKGIIGGVGELIKAGIKVISDLYDSLLKWLGIRSPSRKMADGIGRFISEGIGKGILDFASSVINAGVNVVSSAYNAISNWVSSFRQVGYDIIAGLVSGIKNAATSAANAVVETVASAYNAAIEWLGIASPSKRFRDEIGKWIPAGIAVGIEDNSAVVEDSVIDLFDSDIPDFKKLVPDIKNADAIKKISGNINSTSNVDNSNNSKTIYIETFNNNSDTDLEELMEEMGWKIDRNGKGLE